MASTKRSNPATPARGDVNSLKTIASGSAHRQNPEFEHLSTKKLLFPEQRQRSTSSITCQLLLQTAKTLLSQNFQPCFPDYCNLCSEWLAGAAKEIRSRLHGRLTKLSYLQPSLQFQGFSVMEAEVVGEWGKNPLLKGLKMLWAHVFLSRSFSTLQEIANYYNAFSLFITQISQFMYRQCFARLRKTDFPLRSKLRYQTAPIIITSLPEWPQIRLKVIQPLIDADCPSFSENFDIRKLQMDSRILNLQTPKLHFCKTAAALRSFTKSSTVEELVSGLSEYRSRLLCQIEENVSQWKERCGRGGVVTVEKEDVLGSIIYTLVAHGLSGVSAALKYLSLVMGGREDEVLAWHRVDSYRVDLQVAVEFLTHPLQSASQNGSHDCLRA